MRRSHAPANWAYRQAGHEVRATLDAFDPTAVECLAALANAGSFDRAAASKACAKAWRCGRPDNQQMIRLIVGLGNPGPEYEQTRHNAGFWWVDAAVRRLGASLSFDRNYHGLLARLALPDGALWLLQPMTFMNLSGSASRASRPW